MKKILVFMVLLIGSMMLVSLVLAQDEKEPAGKKIFMEQKCRSCHSIEVVGIKKKPNQKPPDLSTTGSKRNAEFLVKYLKKKEAINEVKHMTAFKGSDEELDTLATWLESLKGEGETSKDSTKSNFPHQK